MEAFDFALEQIVLKIKRTEKLRKSIAEKLRSDGNYVKSIKPTQLNGLIMGVDGGVERKSLHGFDLLLLKAVAVIYSYKNGKLTEVKYFPSALTQPEPLVLTKAYSDLELDTLVNIKRQIKEAETATEAIKQSKPDVLLMDGSILPHYSYVQSRDSPLYEYYLKMIESYRKLFLTAKEENVLLAGVIKDSRGSRFCEIISSNFSGEEKALLEESKDISVLEYLLSKGERTIEFDYTDNPAKHPIVKEFSGFVFKSFYFKPSEFDVPVRVDMLGEEVDKVASIVTALIPSESYAVPAILIEADQRARISKEEMIRFYNDILTKVGPLYSLREMRRDRRPF